MEEPKSIQPWRIAQGFEQVQGGAIPLRLRKSQKTRAVGIGDEMRVERLAVARNPVKGVKVCFQKIGPCPHFGKDDKVIELWHRLLSYQIGSARRRLGGFMTQGHRKITHQIGVHPLVLEVLQKLAKAR